jgi:hypothetical protein
MLRAYLVSRASRILTGHMPNLDELLNAAVAINAERNAKGHRHSPQALQPSGLPGGSCEVTNPTANWNVKCKEFT